MLLDVYKRQNMEWLPTFIIAYIGNILPIPFILLFIRYIFKVLKKTPMRRVVEWCERRAEQKSEQIRKYAYWGVFLFVAVPLPGTGAWMGALISALLGMDPKKTFPVIMLGVLTAGIIVSVLSFGLLGSLGPVSYTHLDVYKRQKLGMKKRLTRL